MKALRESPFGGNSVLGMFLFLIASCTSARKVQVSAESQIYLSLVSSSRPAGWDNEKKIAILHENFTTVKPEDAYEDFIVKPPVRKV